MLRTSLVAGALLFASGNALAVAPDDFNLSTAQDLADLCSVTTADRNHRQAIGECLGFIEGVAQFHKTAVATRRLKPVYCIPAGTRVTKAEAVNMYLSWAKANKAFMQKSALEGLLRAAAAQWPCVK